MSEVAEKYQFVKEGPHWRTLDMDGRTLPWYTRPCLEWLVQYVKPEMTIFEYGCGHSSHWYFNNGCYVLGVDKNVEWIFYPFHQTLASEKDWYLRAIEIETDYDLIIIDGDFRDDCTEHALKRLNKGGYLIADNFEQASADLAHWPKTRELTKNMPVTFYKEPGHPDWCTAVFQNV